MTGNRGTVPVSLHYHFRQSLRAPAADAFEWCIDFGPGDGPLFSERHERTVRWLAPDLAILTDTTYPEGRPLHIRRLVSITRDHRAWTNTHLDGPYLHSQYWYRVIPRGAHRSVLDFTGHRVVWLRRRPSDAEVRRLTAAERRIDVTEWRTRLAPAHDREVAGKSRRRAPTRRNR